MTEEEYMRLRAREWIMARDFMANLRREAAQRYTVRGREVIWDAVMADERMKDFYRDATVMAFRQRWVMGLAGPGDFVRGVTTL